MNYAKDVDKLTASTSTWRPPTREEDLVELEYFAKQLSKCHGIINWGMARMYVRKIKDIGTHLRILEG